ncbi:Maf family nucleotide pyrophosphatase [Reichenbachiella versicolor]|uniref:Maf family nucleotide pyrophosphatase n=1 Tax=Reichenbachiella versicolor TaxID=1821036 RepID=UPI000D6E857D|nr:Maf family nucleotide pyrophosphatase [Reichenbachiella versicolor]
MKELILASNSPRRQELMREAGFAFTVRTLDVDESFDDSIPVLEVAEYIAKKKNKAYRKELKDEIILTSDTVVIVEDEILGKPVDEKDAFRMLNSMIGGDHLVISAVCISSVDKEVSFSDIVKVTMNELSEEEIRFYIDKYKPYDKAGAYGVQEWIGMVAINEIKGSYYTVMGLPIHKVYRSLKEDFNILPF